MASINTMEMEKYEILNDVYASPANKVRLVLALVRATRKEVYIKFVSGVSQADFKLIAKEGENQQRLNQHPYVCKVVDFFRMPRGPGFDVVLVLEKCKCDLSKLAEDRKDPFDEADLMQFLQQCTSALAYGQDFVALMQGICHRDIKPGNVLIGEDDNVRICDFGSSRIIEEAKTREAYTLQGTPQFLSPLLRRELHTYLMTNKLVKVKHNPYKSDVFSLGYTILVLALMRDSDCGRILENMQSNIERTVNSLDYSDSLKNLLIWMMRVEESDRPDFRELQAYLKQSGSMLEAPVLKCALYSWHNFASESCDDAPVALPCAHVFCSKHCFLDYVFIVTASYCRTLDSVACPRCEAQIANEVIYQALGGREEYECQRKMLTHACLQCNKYCTTRRFNCYHRLCKACWRQLRPLKNCPDGGCRAAAVERCFLF